ncbi:MAG: Crp/Fnr family transcriptional regulator [Deltaproteobacteria bacterium]|nr:Crp/Fnr family transcriptional regulator [Deltaproteobacteria bacterium]
MNLVQYMFDPKLKNYFRFVQEGEYVFRQGEQGSSMFVVVEGQLELIDEDGGTNEYIVATMESGQFLGETAIIRETPYQRRYSARAKTNTTVLELSLENFDEVHRMIPDLMRQLLRLVVERLDTANYLMRILRHSNPVQRLSHLIFYFCRNSGKRVDNGIEVDLTPERIQRIVDFDLPTIQKFLEELTRQGILVKGGADHYLVPDENRLLECANKSSKVRRAG